MPDPGAFDGAEERDATDNVSEPVRLAVTLGPERLLRRLLWIIAGLALMSSLGRLAFYWLPSFPLRDGAAYLVWMNHEQSVPTLFSVLLLLACVAALAVVGAASRRRHAAGVGYWWALTGIFAFLTFDEFLSLHERLIEPVREQFGTSGLLYNAWVLPGIALVVGLGLIFYRFVARLPPDIRRLTITAATIYVGGAVAMEMLGGWYADNYGADRFGYVPFPTAEETLEMAGAAVFLSALVRHLRDHLGGVHLTISSSD